MPCPAVDVSLEMGDLVQRRPTRHALTGAQRDLGCQPGLSVARQKSSRVAMRNCPRVAMLGYAISDLVMPAEVDVAHLDKANVAAREWCAEINARMHTEICAVPAERVVSEVSC
jgi:hypothetical protein